MSTTQKYFTYKVFKKASYLWNDTLVWDSTKWDGEKNDLLVGVWRNDVINDPQYRTLINGSDGEMVIRLARPYDDFGEGIDVVLNNTVEVWCYDKESPNGQLMYRGFISGYIPTLQDESEYVDVRIKGFGITLANSILKDVSGNTTITYTSQDPSTIFKDILDKFIDNENGKLGYTVASVENTATTVSYTFNTNTYREALDKCIELSPSGWYWRIEPSGILSFKPKSTSVTHQFNSKKDIKSLSPEKNIEDFYNEVYFIGGDTGSGDNLYVRKRNVVSQDNYGIKILKFTDNRVTSQATAETIIDRILDEKSTPARRTVVEVVDSNGTGDNGYDLESLKVGETVIVGELTAKIPTPNNWNQFVWDSDVWDNIIQADSSEIMQITSISYSPDLVSIEATTRIPEISQRVEQVDKKLEGSVFVNNPATPTLIN